MEIKGSSGRMVLGGAPNPNKDRNKVVRSLRRGVLCQLFDGMRGCRGCVGSAS